MRSKPLVLFVPFLLSACLKSNVGSNLDAVRRRAIAALDAVRQRRQPQIRGASLAPVTAGPDGALQLALKLVNDTAGLASPLQFGDFLLVEDVRLAGDATCASARCATAPQTCWSLDPRVGEDGVATTSAKRSRSRPTSRSWRRVAPSPRSPWMKTSSA